MKPLCLGSMYDSCDTQSSRFARNAGEYDVPRLKNPDRGPGFPVAEDTRFEPRHAPSTTPIWVYG